MIVEVAIGAIAEMRKCICKREQPKDGKRNSKRRRKEEIGKGNGIGKKIVINVELVVEDLGANRSELESQGSIKRIGHKRQILCLVLFSRKISCVCFCLSTHKRRIP